MTNRYNGKFLQDITIPDDTPITAGESFVKTWLVQNNGTAPWENGFNFVFVKGTPMTDITRIPLPPCPPGGQVQISVSLTAPSRPGTYFCDWRFQDNRGVNFGEIIFTRIISKARPAAAKPNPAPAAGTNNSYFLADVTIPDDTQIQPNATFVKTWRIRNNGTLPWTQGYTLNCMGGTAMTPMTSLPVPTVAPGGEVQLSVSLTAPNAPGTYYADWRLKDAQGQPFGAVLWVRIVVPAPVGVTPGPAQRTSDAPAGFKSLSRHYSQRDPRWSNVILGNHPGAPSIGRWGCMMTTFTMLATTYGHEVDPGGFNQLMIARGGFVNGYFTSWNALQRVYPNIIFEGKLDGTPDMLQRIDAKLQAGKPVPVMVDLTPNTRYSDVDQHWVLLVGRNGEDYLMNDPWMLDGQPVSLLRHYGRPGGGLRDAILSAILYR